MGSEGLLLGSEGKILGHSRCPGAMSAHRWAYPRKIALLLEYEKKPMFSLQGYVCFMSPCVVMLSSLQVAITGGEKGFLPFVLVHEEGLYEECLASESRCCSQLQSLYSQSLS